MHAERDIRIRNRMMAVLGILKCYSTRIASDFADVDRRTVQLWVARFDEDGIDGLRDAPGRGRTSRTRYGLTQETGRQACRQEHAHPQKAAKLDTRETRCQVQSVQRAQDPALPRVSSKRSATMYASAAGADAVRQWQAGAAGTISGAKRRRFTIVVQDESIFLRTGTNGRKRGRASGIQ